MPRIMVRAPVKSGSAPSAIRDSREGEKAAASAAAAAASPSALPSPSASSAFDFDDEDTIPAPPKAAHARMANNAAMAIAPTPVKAALLQSVCHTPTRISCLSPPWIEAPAAAPDSGSTTSSAISTGDSPLFTVPLPLPTTPPPHQPKKSARALVTLLQTLPESPRARPTSPVQSNSAMQASPLLELARVATPTVTAEILQAELPVAAQSLLASLVAPLAVPVEPTAATTPVQSSAPSTPRGGRAVVANGFATPVCSRAGTPSRQVATPPSSLALLSAAHASTTAVEAATAVTAATAVPFAVLHTIPPSSLASLPSPRLDAKPSPWRSVAEKVKVRTRACRAQPAADVSAPTADSSAAPSNLNAGRKRKSAPPPPLQLSATADKAEEDGVVAGAAASTNKRAKVQQQQTATKCNALQDELDGLTGPVELRAFAQRLIEEMQRMQGAQQAKRAQPLQQSARPAALKVLPPNLPQTPHRSPPQTPQGSRPATPHPPAAAAQRPFASAFPPYPPALQQRNDSPFRLVLPFDDYDDMD